MANNTNMINKLPSIFQTVTERKFFDATFDQVFSKKNSTRETGFIGRRNPDEFDPINDYYLPEPTKDRTWYQLEPTAVSKDADTLEKTNRYFYDDLVNRLSFFGGDITNHDRIFDTRYYSYAPPVNMDKYVNYQSYYWVPDRIPTIEIIGMTKYLIDKYIDGKANFNTSQYMEDENGDPVIDVLPANIEFTNTLIVQFIGSGDDYDKVLTVGGLGEVGGISLTESISDVLSVPDYNDLLSAQDYFTMAPNSIDQNAWSRTNRWYHIDTINKSLLATEQSFPDNATRALRPILEFNKNIELFESGTRLLSTVNYFLPNTYGTSIIGNPITSTPYQVGDLFVLPDDPAYVGSVLELSAPGGIMALTMKYQALYNDLIIVVSGDLPVSGGQRGMTYFFDNGEWFESTNRKTNVNQPIQFNLYDSDFNVLNDENKYPNNDFSGSEIFMYKLDDDVTASLDSVLNLPIVYNTLGQLSDIVFENRLQSETFNYIIESDILDISGYYYYRIVDSSDSSDDNSTWTYQNSWYAAPTVSKQRVVDMEAVFDVSQTEYILSVDPVQYPGGEYDVIVEINGEETHDYTIGPKNGNTVLTFNDPRFEVNDIVNAYSYTYDSLEEDARGYFEIPQQLAGNPNNEEVVEQSYGELIPHFVTIMGNQEGFEGSTLGFNNYNDTPQDLSLGTLIVQNDASLLKAMLVSSEDDLDVITATRFANNEYVNFKSKFLKVARQQQIQNPTPLLGVDDIANDIQLNNIFDVLTISKGFSNSFAYSYMIGITDVFTIEDSVIDVSDTWTISVDLTNPKNAMYLYVVEDLTDNGVYDNAKLLLLNVDYALDYVDGDTVISWINQDIDDMEVTARIYQDAPPAYIPATPTKLGMESAYIPVLEKDTTFVDPVLMIVGHDGTRTPAWGEINIDESVSTQTFVYAEDVTTDPDIRNDVYFELEKRIYNGLNPEFVKLAPPLVDVDIRPGAFRQLVNGVIQPTEINRYSRKEYYGITESYISKWTAENKADFRINEFYDAGNWMTWNYSKQVDTVLTNTNLPGHWKGIFQYYYDTIRPDTHPWEMLGFSIEPTWWEDTYGADAAQMWEDLEDGYIAGEGRTDLRYARKGLSTIMPVDGSNEIRTISDIFNISETDWEGIDGDWVYGDGAPVESSWYNSPEYRFSETEFFYLMRTSVYSEAFWAPDKNKIIKTGPNTNDYQIIRTDTNERNGTSNVLVHAENVDGEITYRSGYQQYISDRILFLGKNIADTFGTKVRNLTVNLGHKMAAFTDKDTMKVRLTSSSTYSDTGDLLIPTNNYDVHLHTGPSIKDYVYSGLIIRTDEGGKFRVYGYDLLYQSFSVLPASSTRQGFQVNQGGTPATFTNFVFGNTYNAGEFVRYNSAFYQAAITHTADSFNSSYWTKQKSLPQTGGVSVTYYPARESEPVLVPYGSVFNSVQDVYDFIIGYGAWLESEGWEFQTVNASNQVENFKHAGNQFLFWVTSNWEPDNTLLLSPGSQSLTLEVADGYPSNVETMSNGVYSILNKYGLSIAPSATTINRSDQVIQCVPNDAETGVYYFRVSAKETEHVVMFDNVTSFNDTVYEPLLQVRQDRLKISCVRTGNWFGKLQAGGYLITNTGLTQNYENIVGSITEYYNTETALDDPELDLATKHLTGYENKDYMDELEITDDVQFNFYQGFIRQKGTLNAISKILRSDNIQDKEDITFFEEWAFKLSNFGGTEDYVTLELASGFNEVKSNPQIYRLNYEQSETGSVKSVTLFNTVELYAVAPPVTIDAPTPPENYEGRNATAVALLGDDKKITSIVVTDPGAGYTTAPRITIGTTTDSGASVFATSQRRMSTVAVEVELDVNKDIAYSIFQPDILHDDLSDSIIDIDIDDNDRCLAKPTDSVVTPMTDVVDYQLPNAGYVHKHDVDYLAFDVTATTELWNGSNIPVENNLIWVAKNTQEDWGVYKVIDNGAVSGLTTGVDAIINELTPEEIVELFGVDHPDIVAKIDDIKETRVNIAAIEGEIEEAEENKVTLKHEVNALDNDIEDNVLEQKQTSKEIANAINNGVPTNGTGATNLVERLRKLENDLVVLQGQIGADIMKCDSITDEITGVKRSIVDTKLEISALTVEAQSISGSERDIDDLNTLLSELETELSELETELDTCEVQYNTDMAAKTALETTINETLADYEAGIPANPDDIDPTVADLTDQLYDQQIVNLGLHNTRKDKNVGAFAEDGTLTENGLEQESDIIIAKSSELIEETNILTTQLAELDSMIVNDTDITQAGIDEKIATIQSGIDGKLAVVIVDFGASAESGVALSRRYLDTHFSVDVVATGVVVIKTKNKESIYKYYTDESLSEVENAYYLTDLDGNNIVFADEFTEEEISELISYYVFENVRYKSDTERGLYSPTTKSWVDSVSNLWTVYSEGGDIHRQQEPLIDTELYENALIRDLDSGDTKVRLPVYDPFKGIIVGIADQNISYKTARDPARYNNSDDPRLLNTNKMFDADQVGKLWWDLSNIRYTYYEQPTAKDDIETDTDSLMYRRDNWGKIFPGATADIYEWVESPRPPKQYSGTGIPRSLTDYVKIETYNRSLDAIQAMYYYWVKDVTEITVNLDNRTIPALEVSRYISNPGSMAYRYFSPVQDTGSTVSNIVANSDAILSNTNNAIQINYKLRDDADANHVQWQLLREGDRFSIIPDDYWDKMVDSLVGYTSVLPISGFGSTTTFVPISQEEGILPVPDPNVPENDKFGLGIRPQQTMFDDIFYARKIMYQSVNTLVAPMQLWADRFIGWDDNITSNDYWSYVDWYEDGYDASNTIAKIQVASLDEIYDLTDTLKDGELVKVYPFVPNPETDFYAIYEYIADEEDFKIVRRQNGTFMMLDTIYTDEYSVILRTEIRELLTALADYVFIDEYKVNENLLFFAMVNYSFSEQQNVNWAFKTTYISFVQDGVILQQYPNYQSDVLDEFVSYVSEVKPYHTKLRDSVTVIASATDEAFGTAFDDFIGSFTCIPIDAPFEDPVYPGEMVTHSCKWVNESITEILRTVDITLDYSRVWKTSRDKSAYWYEQTLFNDKYPDRIDYVNTDPDLYNNTIDYYIDPMVTIDGSGTPIGDLTMPWDSTGWDVSEPTTLDGWRDDPGEWDDGIPIELLNSEGEVAEFSYGWDYSSNITDEDGNPIPPDSIGNLEDFNQETDQLIEGSAFDRVDNTPEEVAILTPNENLVMGMWYAANNEQIIKWDAEDGDGWDFETEENDPARLPVYLGWDSRVLITGSADLFPIIAYRLHYTPLGYISYIRVSYERSTVLVNSLTPTSGSIEVVNTSKLPEPSAIEPGIVWIGSERIEYDSVDGSTLTNLRRGTQGTTPSSHDELSLVQDGSSGQIVPDAESDAIDGLYRYPTDPQSDPNGVKLALTGPEMSMLVTGKDGVTAERLNSSGEVMTFEPSWFDPWFKKELDGNDELISYVPPGGDISGAIPVVFTNSDQGEFIESLPAEIPTTITGRKIPWMF